VQRFGLHWYLFHYRMIFSKINPFMNDLAYSLSIASEDFISKIVGIYLAVSGFVIAGFEHCVANMFFIPVAIIYGAKVNYGYRT
jgi:formate/nitrite transporter FocA (FNT family)